MGHFIESFPVLVVIVPMIVAVLTPLLRPLGREVPWGLAVGATGFSFAVSLKLLEAVNTCDEDLHAAFEKRGKALTKLNKWLNQVWKEASDGEVSCNDSG